MGIFTQNPDTAELSAWGIRVFTLATIPLGFQYTFVDGLTALGITRVSVFLSLFRKTAFLICTLLLPRLFGAAYAFYAEPAADLLGAAVSTTVFLLLFPRLMKKRDAMPDGLALYS